ncbi:MAG: hydrolase [Chitinophagaceae bacterium]
MKRTINSIAVLFFTTVFTVQSYAQKPSPELLNPLNHALVLVDHQSQMGFATKNIEMEVLRNNAGILAGASKIFNIPTVVTTVAAKTFSGPVFPEITEFYAANLSIDRTTMNCWEDLNAQKAIVAKNKKKLVFAGLWTSVCIVGPALSAKAEGFDVYVITDASGDVSREAHEMAVNRMIQAGVKPMTAMQYILELQRDWARSETYKGVTDLIKRFGGSYGVGIQYAQDMLKH